MIVTHVNSKIFKAFIKKLRRDIMKTHITDMGAKIRIDDLERAVKPNISPD